MRRELAFALLAILPATLADSQQAAPSSPPLSTATPPAAQTVYYAGPGVTAPELLPITVTDLATGHCKKLDGTAILSAVVDATGAPHNVDLLVSVGNELDQEAIKLVTAERFKPGTHNGAPAATANSIEVRLKACIENEMNEAGQKVQTLRLHSAPGQKLRLMQASGDPTLGSTTPPQPGERDIVPYKVGGEISAPTAIHMEEARFSDQALSAGYQGVCILSLIVDENGMPQNVHVVRSLGMGLDQKAIEAVRKYRFKPARKRDGTPVAVLITVEVDFHLYK